MTFLGDCYDEKGDTKGSNFSFAVYFTETNVLYYVDPLGWPVPERFIHIMHNLIDNIRGDTRTTPMTICPLHSNINAHDDIDIEFVHNCLEHCWSFYPFQYDNNICGISVIISMCLIAINEAAFLSLRGTTDLSHASFRYLKHISIYNDFLRITIAKWILSGFVDLSLLSANMAALPLRKLPRS